jgi:hypothetical protein
MIEPLPKFSAPRRWWTWVAAIVAADLLWFCSMYPIVPRSMSAAALEALLPVPLLLYIYVVVRVLFWISKRPWSGWARRSACTVLAVVAGATGIWMVAWIVVHTSAVYGYIPIKSL